MKLYKKFRDSSLDISPVGLWTGPDRSTSVYTPSGARIVAWTGDDSTHFCQVEGFGGMVFVVDPKAPPGDCIHPVAKSLLDLIGLLTECYHSSLICNAYRWSRTLFQKRSGTVRPDYKARSVLRALENTYHPPKISDPYGYIIQIQKDFDYGALPLHPDYFEWCPIRPGGSRWDVGFGTGFADWCEKKDAGQELTLRRSFQWHKEEWTIPAVYLCEDGIVIDSYLEVPLDTMARFHKKWGDKDPSVLSIEEQMRRTLDDPLAVDAKGGLFVNGKPAPLRKSAIIRWDPTLENPWNARRTLEHYGLDPDKGYLLRRESFLRRGKNPPIRSIELRLEAASVSVPGQRFIAPRPGENMEFIHPVTGQVHTLTVISQTREALDPNFLSDHPCCYTRLTFSLEPQLSRDMFSIVDHDPGDPFPNGPNTYASAFLTGKIPSAGHFAVSSLRYTPADLITWRMIFRQKLRQDLSVPILP